MIGKPIKLYESGYLVIQYICKSKSRLLMEAREINLN